MPIYKRKLKDGIKFWYKFDHKNKTYHSKAEYETKSQAKKAEADRLSSLKYERAGGLTFRKLCELRMDLVETKSSWYYKDHKNTLKPLVEKWGDLDITQIDRKMITEYLVKMSVDLNKRGKDNYFVNKTLRILKAMFLWALDQDIMDRNPVRVKMFPINKKLKYIPPAEDIQNVIKFCTPEQQNLIRFIMATGARVGEALRATDQDFNNGTVTLWTRKNKLGNLQPRTIEYSPDFPVPAGRTFPRWSEYPRFLEEACKESKIRKFGWHALRHLRASQLIREGRDIVFIRDYLGHQDVSTTNIYLQSLKGGYDETP